MSPRLTIKVSGMGFTLSHWWCLSSWSPPTSSPWLSMDRTELSVWASMPKPTFVSRQLGYRYTRTIPLFSAKYSFELSIFNSRFFAIASNNLVPILDKCFSYSISRTLANQTHTSCWLTLTTIHKKHNSPRKLFNHVKNLSNWVT